MEQFLFLKILYIYNRGFLGVIMPEPIIKYSASVNSFQSLDGTNQTISGIEQTLPLKGASVSTFLGVGTDFCKNTNVVLDYKARLNYDKNGRLNQNLRIRNTIAGDSSATQIRYSPLSINIPLGNNTDFYANPHYSGKYIHQTDEWKHSIGVFAGVTQKFDKNLSISLEAQRYNLQNIKDNSGENWSINAIISYNF